MQTTNESQQIKTTSEAEQEVQDDKPQSERSVGDVLEEQKPEEVE